MTEDSDPSAKHTEAHRQHIGRVATAIRALVDEWAATAATWDDVIEAAEEAHAWSVAEYIESALTYIDERVSAEVRADKCTYKSTDK